jgi:hypothetical protein
MCVFYPERVCLCVCLCVCVRVRERERGSVREIIARMCANKTGGVGVAKEESI